MGYSGCNPTRNASASQFSAQENQRQGKTQSHDQDNDRPARDATRVIHPMNVGARLVPRRRASGQVVAGQPPEWRDQLLSVVHAIHR